MGRCLRRPHTRQERRFSGHRSIIEQDNYRVYLRARRSFHMLPTVWDDLIRGDKDNRSWKRFRKTQYKIKEVL